MGRILSFLRREMVLTIALLAAIVSMFLVPPDGGYLSYVDWDVLMLLFSLMAVVAGLKRAGVVDRVSNALRARAGTARRLTLLLSLACFFASMFVTNDVALIAFVPLTVSLLAAMPATLVYAVSLEAVAANLGSMLTPIGNPQNLYLFAHYDMAMGDFLGAVAPLSLASLALVVMACLPVKGAPVAAGENAAVPALARGRLLLYLAQFALCLLAVFKLVPKFACFAFVLATMLGFDRPSLRGVDYALLGTFACFFVFVGNLARVEAVRLFLTGMIAGRELEAGILASQVISNVPAALMLSGFTERAVPLLRGVNLGGLGTLVASLASLIAFRLYARAPGARTGRFLACFTAMNIAFLALLYALVKLL